MPLDLQYSQDTTFTQRTEASKPLPGTVKTVKVLVKSSQTITGNCENCKGDSQKLLGEGGHLYPVNSGSGLSRTQVCSFRLENNSPMQAATAFVVWVAIIDSKVKFAKTQAK